MKVVTVVGTRPEIIRLSLIIPKLDRHVDHVLIHTGQNKAKTLSGIFFADFGLRNPDHHLEIEEPDFARQIGSIMRASHDVFRDEKPDRLLVLGDTNSALVAIVAKRMGIPVFHMEAGNRCFDPRVPEEVNRRLIDSVSDVLMPYTEASRQNLVAEGVSANRIFRTGNPINEVLDAHAERIDSSDAVRQLGLLPRRYFLVTLHRAENVDVAARLATFTDAFATLSRVHGVPVIVSTHPRTRSRIAAAGLQETEGVHFVEPFGFFDFVALQKQALCVLTDSGTVQEECSILRVPNVTVRDVTERPETIECGSNILTGCDVGAIVRAVAVAMDGPPRWTPPPDYQASAVSDTVLRIVTGYHHDLVR